MNKKNNNNKATISTASLFYPDEAFWPRLSVQTEMAKWTRVRTVTGVRHSKNTFQAMSSNSDGGTRLFDSPERVIFFIWHEEGKRIFVTLKNKAVRYAHRYGPWKKIKKPRSSKYSNERVC